MSLPEHAPKQGAPGRYIPMRDDEAWHFLATGRRVMRLATVDRVGDPHVVPVWFAVIDRWIGIRSASDAGAKIGNALRTGRFAGVVDEGERYEELRGVMLRGSARRASDEDASRINSQLSMRYHRGRDDFAQLPVPVRTILETLSFTYLVLTPEHITSWDNTQWRTRSETGAGGDHAP